MWLLLLLPLLAPVQGVKIVSLTNGTEQTLSSRKGLKSRLKEVSARLADTMVTWLPELSMADTARLVDRLEKEVTRFLEKVKIGDKHPPVGKVEVEGEEGRWTGSKLTNNARNANNNGSSKHTDNKVNKEEKEKEKAAIINKTAGKVFNNKKNVVKEKVSKSSPIKSNSTDNTNVTTSNSTTMCSQNPCNPAAVCISIGKMTHLGPQ